MNETPQLWVTDAPVRLLGFDRRLSKVRVPMRPVHLTAEGGKLVLREADNQATVAEVPAGKVIEAAVSRCSRWSQIVPAFIKAAVFAVAAFVFMIVKVAARVGAEKMQSDPHGTATMAALILVGGALGLALFIFVIPAWFRSKPNLWAVRIVSQGMPVLSIGVPEESLPAVKQALASSGVEVV